MDNTRTIGALGEELAKKYLVDRGYCIIERNFKVKVGEIDIVAIKDDTIIFIEVKSRSNNNYGLPYEAVNYRKQQKIIRTAQHYINLKRLSDSQCRFDVIEVFLKDNNRINHIENAFWT